MICNVMIGCVIVIVSVIVIVMLLLSCAMLCYRYVNVMLCDSIVMLFL